MNTIINAILARLGLLPTTEGAIAGVTKAIEQLNAVVARENAEIERQRVQMEAARRLLVDAAARADRAEVIAARFTALVEG
jgi:uncharacterized coiled-coil protein SlyX